jgi:glucose-1-phosphate thymidylyltransferase
MLLNATVGPNVSLGKGCRVENATVKKFLIQTIQLKKCDFNNAMIGNHARLMEFYQCKHWRLLVLE